MNAMKEQGIKDEKVVLKKQQFWENKSCYSKHEKISISTDISEVLEDKFRNYWPEK